jgi:hypothetical protein
MEKIRIRDKHPGSATLQAFFNGVTEDRGRKVSVNTSCHPLKNESASFQSVLLKNYEDTEKFNNY